MFVEHKTVYDVDVMVWVAFKHDGEYIDSSNEPDGMINAFRKGLPDKMKYYNDCIRAKVPNNSLDAWFR